jgi:hypothetical protein
MATKLVLKTATLRVGNTTLTAADGSDLSAYVESLTLNANIEELDDTTFGAAAKSATGGLEDNTLQVNFMEGTSLATVQGVLWALRGTEVFCSVRLTNAGISAANPEYQFKALVAGAFPIGGQVGQIAKMSLTWRINTVVTYDTTA